jgi:cytoskeletal protein RodZ
MELIATDIGSRLRQAREHRGLTLRDIAATTKISMTALVAIERNDFDRLPSGVFRSGYVKAFAAEVGLNADELAREYRASFETEPPAAQPPLPESDWKARLRLVQGLPNTLVIIVGIVVVGSLLWDREGALHEGSDGPDTPVAAEVDIPDATAQTDDSDGAAEVAVADAAVADLPPSLRLEIHTTGVCWVYAVADGKRAVYRLMQPGERARVEARLLITLRVGDAGAVAFSINGTTGRPLGRTGEAVTVRITNENLGSLSAEPPRATSATDAATRLPAGSVGRAWGAAGQRAVTALMIRSSHQLRDGAPADRVGLVSP